MRKHFVFFLFHQRLVRFVKVFAFETIFGTFVRTCNSLTFLDEVPHATAWPSYCVCLCLLHMYLVSVFNQAEGLLGQLSARDQAAYPPLLVLATATAHVLAAYRLHAYAQVLRGHAFSNTQA